jgi:hypothetical protein
LVDHRCDYFRSSKRKTASERVLRELHMLSGAFILQNRSDQSCQIIGLKSIRSIVHIDVRLAEPT